MPLSRITSPFQSATANVYSPSANTVAIRTASADRVTVNPSGNVGIGTTSASRRLSLSTSSANVGISMFSANNFFFQDIDYLNDADGLSGRIRYYPADGYMSFWTSNAERFRLNVSGGASVNTSASLATLTVNGNICPAQAPSASWGLDFAPSTSAGAYVSLANDATYDLATGSGIVWVYENAGNGVAQMYAFYGSVGITNITAALFSPTINTSGKINFYYESGTGKYRFQNKTGATSNLYISTIRLRANS